MQHNLLLWFRNDLRMHDNPALCHFLANLPREKSGKAIFFVSEKQWLAHDWSPIKIDFIKRHADVLVAQLTALNIALEIVEVDDFKAQEQYIIDYCNTYHIEEVCANSELECNEQARDALIINKGIPLTLFEADVIVPKGAIKNKSGKMYKVFTPFRRAWLTYAKAHRVDVIATPQPDCGIISCTEFDKTKAIKSLSSDWPLSSHVETISVGLFIRNKIKDYAALRDIPSVKGTSALSPYLANGVISPRLIFSKLVRCYPDILVATDSPEFCWLNELIWRDFYRHLLFDQPRLSKHECFNAKYHEVLWPFNGARFHAWCEGKTGYPLVDAAMRQLNQTGWMHNRLRMVVASFLTKHLLIDWRLGEKYFMQHLIDGDLASNNGGWQWASSTGCDAQPYFRIFNPIRQSERFDSKGRFIRKYLPELRDIPEKHIHFPHQFIHDNNLNIYWPAVVDHKQARIDALSFYK